MTTRSRSRRTSSSSGVLSQWDHAEQRDVEHAQSDLGRRLPGMAQPVQAGDRQSPVAASHTRLCLGDLGVRPPCRLRWATSSCRRTRRIPTAGRHGLRKRPGEPRDGGAQQLSLRRRQYPDGRRSVRFLKSSTANQVVWALGSETRAKSSTPAAIEDEPA